MMSYGGGYAAPSPQGFAMRPPTYGQPQQATVAPPMPPGGPYGYGYPTSLGSGYSYAPYPMQQMQPIMYANRAPPQGLYSSYNSSLYSTPRRGQDLYSSTSSLTTSSNNVKRAVSQTIAHPTGRRASPSGNGSFSLPNQQNSTTTTPTRAAGGDTSSTSRPPLSGKQQSHPDAVRALNALASPSSPPHGATKQTVYMSPQKPPTMSAQMSQGSPITYANNSFGSGSNPNQRLENAYGVQHRMDSNLPLRYQTMQAAPGQYSSMSQVDMGQEVGYLC